MRIAFIVSTFPSLSQTFILNQITGLIDKGHEVDIYTDKVVNTTKIHLDVEKYKLLDKTYYFNIPPGRITRKLKGLRLALINFYYHPGLLYRIMKSFKNKEEIPPLGWIDPYIALPFFRKKPYDIISCHFGPNGLKGLQLKKLGLIQGKLVTTFHGYDLTKFLQIHGKDSYKELFKDGDIFLPISEYWKHRLIELGCDQNKILVHRMGVDFRKFSFIPRCLEADGKIRITTVARLVEKKGVEYGIRAVAKLLKLNQKVEYHILGDGVLKENLQQLINELGAENNIKLLGWKQQHEIVQILSKTHLLLAPSITSSDGDTEGIPVVLMEAMAMGLPVISTEHSGIPELVENGKSGFLVPERDIDALFEKLNYLIEYPQSWVEMGKSGRNYVEKYYSIDKQNNQLVNSYQKLLEKQ